MGGSGGYDGVGDCGYYGVGGCDYNGGSGNMMVLVVVLYFSFLFHMVMEVYTNAVITIDNKIGINK